MGQSSGNAVRLPKNLRPYKYFVNLRPDIYSPDTGFPFNGTVIIDFSVDDTTNQIILSQRQINVRNFFLFRAPDNTIPDSNVPRWSSPVTDDSKETVEIPLDGTLTEGARYRVALFFDGEMPVLLPFRYFLDFVIISNY